MLSAGHACILQYSALHLTGYDLTMDDLRQFRQWGSRTPGHPEFDRVVTTRASRSRPGPLGQGIGNAVGMALAEAMLAERYNRDGHDVVDHRTCAICSDGDLMEGVSSEAGSLAGHLGLGKLTLIYDDNHITIEGDTALALHRGRRARASRRYGWHVQRVDDAWTLDRCARRSMPPTRSSDRPSLIVLRTHIAQGAPNAQDTPEAHGAPLGEDEVRADQEVYGWNPDLHFYVPDGVYAHMDARPRGAELQCRLA